MNKDSRIFVAGHRGMVGSAICRSLHAQGYRNVITRSRVELALDDGGAVASFFAAEHPDYVFVAAAKVGGILANATCGADFIRENLLIQTNVIHNAYVSGAKKLLFLGSSCIYPREAPQPIREDSLLTGPLEETNLPYAVAKIAGKVMCDAYRRQYGFNAFTAMPSNVYGINDNFDPQNSHVVAGLMRRLTEATEAGASQMVAWGTGSPMRELIDADDLASACVFLMENYEDGGMINVGSNEEISVRELTGLIANIVGFPGNVVWDASKPDGTPRKIMDNSRLFALGWRPQQTIESGLRRMYAWYRDTRQPARTSTQPRGNAAG